MRQVNLKEALKNPRQYGDLSWQFISYTPDYSEVKFLRRETGYYDIQVAKTQMNMGYHAILYKGRVYLIPGGEVEYNKIKLSSLIGIYGEAKFLKDYGRMLFSNKTLGAKGEAFTKSMLKSLPEHLKRIGQSYFIAAPSSQESRVLMCTGNRGDIYQQRWNIELGIRPIILLPSDVMIDLEDKDRDGLLPRTSLHIWRPNA